MTTDDSIDALGRELNRQLDALDDLTPIAPQIEAILRTSIDRNFSEGGRFGTENVFGGGSQKWKQSGRAKKDAGETLVDTGILAASTLVMVTGREIAIGTNLVYGPIHHFGGEAGRNHSVTITPRPIYVIQNEDLEDISAVLVEYLAKRMEK